MSWIADLDKAIERFYSHFLIRDATYIAGGGVVITTTLYCFGKLNEIADLPLWHIVGLVVGAYLIGFAAQELSATLGLFRMYPRGRPYVDQEAEYLFRRHTIFLRWGYEAVVSLERIIIIKQIAAVVGSCSLLAIIIVWSGYFLNEPVIKWRAIYVTFILGVCLTASLSCNWRKARVQSEIIRQLFEQINAS